MIFFRNYFFSVVLRKRRMKSLRLQCRTTARGDFEPIEIPPCTLLEKYMYAVCLFHFVGGFFKQGFSVLEKLLAVCLAYVCT